MSFRQLKKQPNLRGISASAVATGEIPTTGTHYATYLRCLDAGGVELTRAQIIADIGDLVVRINGEQIVEASATFLLDLQKYYGDSKTAGNVNGIIPLFWERPGLATFQERALFALGMNNVQSFTIDVNVVGVAVLSSIEVYSLVTPERRNLGQHMRISRFPQSFGSTGIQEITSLPKEGASVAYSAMHIEESTGTIDDVTVKLGGNDIYDEVSANLNETMLKVSGRSPQTGYYHADFGISNDLTGMIPMASVQDWRQQINWSGLAPNNYNIYAERIFNLNTK